MAVAVDPAGGPPRLPAAARGSVFWMNREKESLTLSQDVNGEIWMKIMLVWRHAGALPRSKLKTLGCHGCQGMGVPESGVALLGQSLWVPEAPIL